MISIETLRRFPFFNGLDEAQLQALAMLADENKADAKELIFEEGSAANKFYFLVSGNVDLYIKSEEENDPGSRRDYAVGEINPGEVLGIQRAFGAICLSCNGTNSPSESLDRI